MYVRKEQIGDATLYLGDCLEILPTLGPVDAVVTDPPYGVGLEYGSFKDTPENLAALTNEWLPAARCIAQRVAFTAGIKTLFTYPQPDWILCWAISGAGSLSPWGFNCWQPILVYGKDPYLASGRGSRPDLIYKTETSSKNGHPCPKPVGVMERIIDRVSLSGVVLDPFTGSGTTGVACANLGRKFIGIEIEPKYFDIACERIAAAYAQGRLFA